MNKYDSRKYRLAKYTMIAATLLAAVPPLFTMWFLNEPMTLLTGSEWGAIVSAALLFYSGANVAQKKMMKLETEEIKPNITQ